MALGMLGVKPYAKKRGELGLVGATPKAVRDALIRLDVGRDEGGLFDADELHRKWQEEIAQRGVRAVAAGGGGDGGSGEGKPFPAGPVDGERRVLTEGEPQPHGGWLKRQHAEVFDGPPGDLPEDIRSIKATDRPRFLAIKEWELARKHHLANQREEGELLPAEKIRRLMFAERRVVRDRLRNLARREAPALAELGEQADAIRERLELAIERTLADLADDLPALLQLESANAGADDAAEPAPVAEVVG